MGGAVMIDVRALGLWSILCLTACGSPAASEPAEPQREVTASPSEQSPPRAAYRRIRLQPSTLGAMSLPSATACIPPEAAQGPLPVLYAFDGDFFVDDLGLCDELDVLIARGVVPPWIVVGVPSTSAREVMLAGESEALGELIAAVLEPSLAARAALAQGRDTRALLGYSYGGLAALRIAFDEPERFGRVIAMSPSIWWNDQALLEHARRAPLPSRLYVDVGGREGGIEQVVPVMVQDARTLVATLRRRGMLYGREIGLREVPGEPHDMRRARPRIQSALAFALGDHDVSHEPPLELSIALYERAPRRSTRTFTVLATHASGIVLSWPADLASLRLGDDAVLGDRISARSDARLVARVAGVSADATTE